MADLGMICEVNPFHGGHQYLIDSARASGAERIVCVMSGNTVQRGEFAVTDRYRRAEILVRSGADLVLELPFPWSSGSAERFARGGVSVLRHFCDGMIFGSECGDITLLTEAARRACQAEFREKYQEMLRLGAPAAQSYYKLLGGAFSSNDLLGVEYIRAAEELGASLTFRTVKRLGAGYCDVNVADGEYPSAAAIRKLWRDGNTEEANRLLPENCALVIRRAMEEGCMIDEESAERLLLMFFRLSEAESLSRFAGCEGGLANRFVAMAGQSRSGGEFLEMCRTKRYTDSHLRRVMLYCLAGVCDGDLDALPVYTTVLAANDRGCRLLSERRGEKGILAVTKPADAPKDTRQYVLGEKIDRIYTMLTHQIQSADSMVCCGPYIERNTRFDKK